MLKFVYRAFRFYRDNLKVVLLINIVCLFSLFFLMFSNTYIIGGSGFIENIRYDLSSYVFAIFLSFISAGVFSVYLCFLVSFVKLKEVKNPDTLKYLILNLKRFFISVFSFFVILTVLNIVLSYFLPQIIVVIVNLAFIFAPIIIILENADLFESFYKSLIFIKKEPIKFLIFITLFVCIIFLNILFEVILENYIGSFAYVFSVLILSNVIFPMLILSLIELYLENYKISGLGRIY